MMTGLTGLITIKGQIFIHVDLFAHHLNIGKPKRGSNTEGKGKQQDCGTDYHFFHTYTLLA
jgi:hypothetical protein